MKIHNLYDILIIFSTIHYTCTISRIITSNAKNVYLFMYFANLKAQNCISVIVVHLVNEKRINQA